MAYLNKEGADLIFYVGGGGGLSKKNVDDLKKGGNFFFMWSKLYFRALQSHKRHGFDQFFTVAGDICKNHVKIFVFFARAPPFDSECIGTESACQKVLGSASQNWGY